MFDFQDEEQVTIEEDSPRKEEEEEDQETHQKGYRFQLEKWPYLHPKQSGFAALFCSHLIFNINCGLSEIVTTNPCSPLCTQHHFQKT